MTVKQRQNLLQYLGYYEGVPDGDWGQKSREACLAFQQDLGSVGTDGIGGPETDSALIKAVAEGWKKPETEDTWWEDIQYFTREEFRCKCGGKYCNGYPAEMREEIVRICEAARKHFGRPGYIVSGLRCRKWNTVQGGVENSQHMYGEAVDLRIEGTSAAELLAFIQTQPHRYSYKINGTNVHVDVPKGKR